MYCLQGDVVAIQDSTGATVVEYKYNAWGKLLAVTGSMASTLGRQNPIRYRGYEYDEESGLYYLRSRYYNPDTGRFISADSVRGRVGEVLSHNLYCYCDNNPIGMHDYNGNDAIWIQEGKSAVNFGHSGLMVQDEIGEWFYFYWGPPSDESTAKVLTGTPSAPIFDKIDVGNADLRNTDSINEILRNSPIKQKRDNVDSITYSRYFVGDYSKTYRYAQQVRDKHDDYALLTNNCVQNTLTAFSVSDWRFEYIPAAKRLIPYETVNYVDMIPSKKQDFPWKLMFTYILSCCK